MNRLALKKKTVVPSPISKEKGGNGTRVPPGIADPARVSALAYKLWVSRGCPQGDDWNDWFAAEKMWEKKSP